jgi:hypothetical protein
MYMHKQHLFVQTTLLQFNISIILKQQRVLILEYNFSRKLASQWRPTISWVNYWISRKSKGLHYKLHTKPALHDEN